ncbi:SprB repeat-containing protein, partial [Flavobacterium sp. FZUC8N2.13]
MNKLYFKTKKSISFCLLLISTVLFGNLFSVTAQVRVPFTQRASSTAPFTKNYKVKGDFTLIGNTNLTLQSYGDNSSNSNPMVYVDVDGNSNTLNSSSSTLVLPTDDGVASNCSNIVFAGLYWTGRASDGSQSSNTFSVTKNVNTGNTVTQNNTDSNRQIFSSNDAIENTNYKLTITENISSNGNNGTITYTFTPISVGNTIKYTYSYTSNSSSLTKSVNNGNSNVINFTSDNNSVYPSDASDKLIFSDTNYTLVVNRLRRPSSFNPSRAYVDVTYKTTVPEVISVTKNYDKTKISLKGPGDTNYTTISASQNGNNSEIYYPTTSDGFMYSAYADVTSFVKSRGIGEYTAADIALVEGDGGNTGYYGGWSMIIIYENSNMKNRDITVFDGHAYVTGGTTTNFDIAVDGFNAVQTGDVGIKLGLVAGEGDRSISGDYFQIQKLNSNDFQSLNHSGNSATNFFNSSIETGGNPRNPNHLNNTGLDISMFKIPNSGNTIIGNNQTSTKFKYGTTQDTYVIFALAMSVDAYVPEIEGVITATTINGSPVVGTGNYTALPGQELGYKVQIKNKGTEIINNSKIIIPVPYNATYVANSAGKTINFSPLPTPNNLTFDPTLGANGSIVWNIGSLPLPTDPNTVLAELTFKFKVTENCTLLKNANCSNTISVNGLMTGTGATSNVNITDKSLIQGYSGSGNCEGSAIAAPIETTINATEFVNNNCQSTPPIAAFTFCNTGNTIPISDVAGAFPPGSTFYDSLAKTNQYTTNNPFPATVGTKTYYAIPAGVTNGCYFEFTINVTSITSSPTATNVNYCIGDTATELTATKSNPAYTLYYYTSLTSPAQSSITPLTNTAGETTYYVAEGQSNSCIGPKVPIVVTINAKPSLSIANKIEIQCFGTSTGSIDINTNGGTAPYTYTWTKNGNPYNATTEDINNLEAGIYEVTVSDSKNCSSAKLSVTINAAPTEIAFTATPTQPKCAGEKGSVVLSTPTGGTGNITFNNTATTDLAAGEYTYTATDANGCTQSITVTINAAPDAIAFTATPTQPKCFGEKGSVVLSTPTGGTGNITFNNTATTDLAAGEYTYT